jgi:hypothetical protein
LKSLKKRDHLGIRGRWEDNIKMDLKEDKDWNGVPSCYEGNNEICLHENLGIFGHLINYQVPKKISAPC